jgi:uncharacterized membrane protein
MNSHPVNRSHHDEAAWDVRFAEAVTKSFGSLTFIIIQTVVVAVWIGLNFLAFVHHWDPYPFILLNLLFSTQAAYAAPLILLAANRAAVKDRAMAEFDYRHNAETLILLRALHLDAHHGDCHCLARLDALEPTQ